jgi:hypothetical protein
MMGHLSQHSIAAGMLSSDGGTLPNPPPSPSSAGCMLDARPCEACQKARHSCSLTTTNDGASPHDPCARCRRRGLKCVRAPPRKRACTSCKRAKVRCTWDRGNDVCDRCTRLSLTCTHLVAKQRALRPSKASPRARASQHKAASRVRDITAPMKLTIECLDSASLFTQGKLPLPMVVAEAVPVPAPAPAAAPAPVPESDRFDAASGIMAQARPGIGRICRRCSGMPTCSACVAAKAACVGGKTCDRCVRLGLRCEVDASRASSAPRPCGLGVCCPLRTAVPVPPGAPPPPRRPRDTSSMPVKCSAPALLADSEPHILDRFSELRQTSAPPSSMPVKFSAPALQADSEPHILDRFSELRQTSSPPSSDSAAERNHWPPLWRVERQACSRAKRQRRGEAESGEPVKFSSTALGTGSELHLGDMSQFGTALTDISSNQNGRFTPPDDLVFGGRGDGTSNPLADSIVPLRPGDEQVRGRVVVDPRSDGLLFGPEGVLFNESTLSLLPVVDYAEEDTGVGPVSMADQNMYDDRFHIDAAESAPSCHSIDVHVLEDAQELPSHSTTEHRVEHRVAETEDDFAETIMSILLSDDEDAGLEMQPD